MKLGVMNPVLYSMGFEEALAYLASLGVTDIEIGAGGYPGNKHLCAAEITQDSKKAAEYLALLAKYNIKISALSCHGNPLHPQKEISDRFRNHFRNAVLSAEALGVDTLIGFSGCPGDCDTSMYPNWVVCPWPEDYAKVLKWQWEEKIIPYWIEASRFAASHGIKKIAFEMHPGFAVYNPETLLRLRNAVKEAGCGDIIGANVDPSHLFWQGMDPCASIKALKGAIYHFHAKDTAIDATNTAINGVLDTKPYSNIPERSWIFRTVGYGHSKSVWNDIISTLRTVGYDGVISIEHEDALMSPKEGLEKAVAFLKDVIIFEGTGEMWWV